MMTHHGPLQLNPFHRSYDEKSLEKYLNVLSNYVEKRYSVPHSKSVSILTKKIDCLFPYDIYLSTYAYSLT